MGQSQARGVFLQLHFDRAGAHDHDRVVGVGHRVEQDVQALVIAQYADEEEEFVAHLLAPVVQPLLLRLGVNTLVQAVRDDARLVAVAVKHGRRGQVVGRGRDDGVDALQKPVLERLIQAQQHFLPHDVGVVRHQAWLVDARHEVRQVGERPRKVIVHHVAFGGAPTQLAKGGQ